MERAQLEVELPRQFLAYAPEAAPTPAPECHPLLWEPVVVHAAVDHQRCRWGHGPLHERIERQGTRTSRIGICAVDYPFVVNKRHLCYAAVRQFIVGRNVEVELLLDEHVCELHRMVARALQVRVAVRLRYRGLLLHRIEEVDAWTVYAWSIVERKARWARSLPRCRRRRHKIIEVAGEIGGRTIGELRLQTRELIPQPGTQAPLPQPYAILGIHRPDVGYMWEISVDRGCISILLYVLRMVVAQYVFSTEVKRVYIRKWTRPVGLERMFHKVQVVVRIAAVVAKREVHKVFIICSVAVLVVWGRYHVR